MIVQAGKGVCVSYSHDVNILLLRSMPFQDGPPKSARVPCLSSAPPRRCVSELLASGAVLAFRNAKTAWEFKAQTTFQTYESPSHPIFNVSAIQIISLRSSKRISGLFHSLRFFCDLAA
ncbi:hypothetical protein OAG29_03415, partial [Planctomycetaceae bacterium]|nr:hypothetical protein [Planctomycetaceae bacterium]